MLAACVYTGAAAAQEVAPDYAAIIAASDRTDADRRIQGGPEVKFVRCVGATLGGDDSSQNCCHSNSEL